MALCAFHKPENPFLLHCSGTDLSSPFLWPFCSALYQVSCVINNFKPTQIAASTPPPPQRPEPPMGMPLLSLPRVESPLEKLSGLQVRDGGNLSGKT